MSASHAEINNLRLNNKIVEDVGASHDYHVHSGHRHDDAIKRHSSRYLCTHVLLLS